MWFDDSGILQEVIVEKKVLYPMHYVYIVECQDGSLYTGWTTDLKKRVNQHNLGKGAKYTRSRCPVVLRYYEIYSTREEALKREHMVKKYTHRQKLELFRKED